MPNTWKCLKQIPWVALPLLVLAAFGYGALGDTSGHLFGGLLFIVVGMLFLGVCFDVIRWVYLTVRWLVRAAAG